MILTRIILLASLVSVASIAWGLEAGAAKVRLTLPPGTSLDGDPTRLGHSATGEHDPLWARCVYLDDGETVVYLVNVDLFRVSRTLREAVVTRAESFVSAPETIFLAATHTLHGPGGMDDRLAARWTSGRRQQETIDAVAAAVVDAMMQARDTKRRATFGYGTGRQRILASNMIEDGGPVDEQIGVIRIDDADGKAIAIATNFAAAPVLVPAEAHYRFSAGYPGAYYRKMEELTDPGCVAMFFMGAGGNQAPGNPDNGDGWAQIESIGGELALGAKAVANDMTFHDVTLQVEYREAAFPETLAEVKLPESVILQTLEVNGLLMTFVPFMPDVEIGLELRQRALSDGYRAQFTVGLSNEYAGYLTPRSKFGVPREPGKAQLFGPGLESWFYDEVLALARGEAGSGGRRVSLDTSATQISGHRVTLRGSGYERGYRRGAMLQDTIDAQFSERVVARVQSGALRPQGEMWAYWPGFLDPSPLALPALGIAARASLTGLDEEIFSEIEGYAVGAGLPFDAGWLLQQHTGRILETEEPAEVVSLEALAFALLEGEESAIRSAVVGYQVRLGTGDLPLISTVEPEEGYQYLQLGLDWQLGAWTGMNQAGVVLCLEQFPTDGPPGSSGLPAPMLLRRVLQYAGDYDEAVALLQEAVHLRDARVLVSGPGDEGRQGAVVTFGKRVSLREGGGGLLCGVELEEGVAVEDRYQEIATRLGVDVAVGDEEARGALNVTAGRGGVASEDGAAAAVCSVIFRPDRLQMEYTLEAAGSYQAVQLSRGTVRE